MPDPLSEDAIDAMRRRVVRRIREENAGLLPVFYAVSGSHLHGVSGPNSDIDIRGFHCADGIRYALFDEPKPRIAFSTEFPSVNAEIDAVSYELRTFGTQLRKSDFTTVELLFGAQAVLNEVPEAVTAARSIVEAALPGEVPNRYAGMARSLYRRYLAPDAVDRDEATVKLYVHSLRGALAAEYVRRNRAIEPELVRLAEALLDPEARSTVRTLLDLRRAGDSLATAPEVEDNASGIVRRTIDEYRPVEVSDEERTSYGKQVAEWMLRLRETTDTA